jgi:HSP20 family molecular chaperone IbpA
MSTEITQTTGQAGEPQESTRGVPVYRPLADIRDTGKGVVLTLEMPGVGREDVEIGLERRVLTIRGRGRVTSPEGYRGSMQSTARAITSGSSPCRRTSTRAPSAQRWPTGC